MTYRAIENYENYVVYENGEIYNTVKKFYLSNKK